MKKIFFFALASLALASCSQDEEFVAEKTNGSNRSNKGALSFSTYTAGGTRATDVTSDVVKTKGFMVAAWYDGGLYFNEGESASVAADEIFDTDNELYYWPSFSAGNIGFRAFNKEVGAAWNTEYESLKFTVAATAEAQKDLVIAYAEASAKPDEGVQPLNFVHALSKVNFSFKGATSTNKYTINKIEIIAAGQNDAVMSFAQTTELASTGSDGDQPGEGNQNSKVSWEFTEIDGDAALVAGKADKTGSEAAQGTLYTFYEGADVVVTGAEAVAVNSNAMLLPQDGKIAVRVYYKVETPKKVGEGWNMIGNCGYSMTDSEGRHGATTGIFGCKTVIVDLGTDNDDSATPAKIPAWEAGKAYRFTMTLPDDNFIGDKDEDGVPDMLDNDVDLDGDNDGNPKEFDMLTPIRFSVTVSDWEDETASSNIVIK
ncbi:MAG: fimbrillin family protein [Bacteroidales bacterium]|jgi:hypothetical protein|nr:fimbrillin family protein [Bacteroidales bacterium]